MIREGLRDFPEILSMHWQLRSLDDVILSTTFIIFKAVPGQKINECVDFSLCQKQKMNAYSLLRINTKTIELDIKYSVLTKGGAGLCTKNPLSLHRKNI